MRVPERIKAVLTPVDNISGEDWRRYLLNIVLALLAVTIAVYGLVFVVLFFLGVVDNIQGVVFDLLLLVICGLAYWLGQKNQVQLAGQILSLSLFGAVTMVLYRIGIGHLSALIYILAAVIAALLSGVVSALMIVALSSVAYLVIGNMQSAGQLPYAVSSVALMIPDTISLVVSSVAVVLSIWIFGERVNRIIQQYSESERQASELAENLEVLVEERTHALQQANSSFQRRAMYLEASVQVSLTLATLFELDSLLDQAVNLITHHFDFYHTGIFLIDEAGEWSILQAASSEGGRQMLAAGHRLRRGEDSMVGWVMLHRQARIASDVGEDAHHFANPYLPATRSEATLPLIAAGRLIGVLDVQSTEEAAFDKDDIRALEGMAGQLAVAINNAKRLRGEAEMLEAASPFYRLARRLATAGSERDVYAAILETVRDYTPNRAFILNFDRHVNKENLSSVAGAVHIAADMRPDELIFPNRILTPEEFEQQYSLLELAFDLEDVLLIDDFAALSSEVEPALCARLSKVGAASGAHSLALVPIHTGEYLIGIFIISYYTVHTFSPIEQQLYRALADLVGVALGRTQLVYESQRRVERERQMREFTETLSRIPDLQVVMEQAAEALQELVLADGVLIALDPTLIEGEEETV
ncbi:MAG: GAF domain-containing protein [Anaerolineae bacterium]|nr:GAF domain-containing protein [Anaerolineae bacterium]